MISTHGTATYAILWAIVFCETGLVLTPFLPGDSLLFAAGTFAGMGALNPVALFACFVSAAILGDALNYAIGSFFGAGQTDRRTNRQTGCTWSCLACRIGHCVPIWLLGSAANCATGNSFSEGKQQDILGPIWPAE
jgi:membrane protein YqaA with SNARE-associated domain